MGKVVMVRFDSNVLLGEKQDKMFISALSTIKYLHEAGAMVILMSSWSVKTNSNLLSADFVSGMSQLFDQFATSNGLRIMTL